MSHGRYRWGLDLEPPSLGEHSQVKHDVYRQYLRRYLNELTKRTGYNHYGIDIFDTFSGGGIYCVAGSGERYYGSPIIVLQVLQEMQVEIQGRQRNEFLLDWRLHLIDADAGAHQVLRRTLQEQGFGHLIGSRILLHTDRLDNALPGLVARLPSRRKAIFLMDQFGYKSVPFSILGDIFGKLKKPEVILTFAFDQLSRWMQDYDRLACQLDRLDVEGLTREAYEAAIGFEHGLEALVQKLLHKAFLKVADYYTPFFITSRRSHVSYWLVHLSMHARARDVMTNVHWSRGNGFAHFAGSGYNMLGFDPYNAPPNSQGHMFDEGARERTVWQLQEDLPRMLRVYDSSVAFRDFFAEHANSSPADSDITRLALIGLAERRQIVVLTEDGGPKRAVHSLGMKDRLVVPEQPTFHFLSGPIPAYASPSNVGLRVKVPKPVQARRRKTELGPSLLPDPE